MNHFSQSLLAISFAVSHLTEKHPFVCIKIIIVVKPEQTVAKLYHGSCQ